jgi:hypothetical protein
VSANPATTRASRSFLRNGEYLDQALWTILDEDWRSRTLALASLH